jgi:hypothetical protein
MEKSPLIAPGWRSRSNTRRDLVAERREAIVRKTAHSPSWAMRSESRTPLNLTRHLTIGVDTCSAELDCWTPIWLRRAFSALFSRYHHAVALFRGHYFLHQFAFSAFVLSRKSFQSFFEIAHWYGPSTNAQETKVRRRPFCRVIIHNTLI